MSNIDIVTTHNITVSHQLASPMQRAIAMIIDSIIIFIYCYVVISFTGGHIIVLVLFILPAVGFYHLLMEVYNEGQSLGKRMMGLRVVSIEGISPDLEDYVQRWMFRLVDIGITSGVLAFFCVQVSNRNQRIGDVIAGTTVIKLDQSVIDLKQIKALDLYKDQVRYPEVVQYNDQDMLLIKQSLIRYKQHKNEANAKIIKELKNKIVADLKLSPEESRQIKTLEFLKVVLQDYVLLTR